MNFNGKSIYIYIYIYQSLHLLKDAFITAIQNDFHTSIPAWAPKFWQPTKKYNFIYTLLFCITGYVLSFLT